MCVGQSVYHTTGEVNALEPVWWTGDLIRKFPHFLFVERFQFLRKFGIISSNLYYHLLCKL